MPATCWVLVCIVQFLILLAHAPVPSVTKTLDETTVYRLLKASPPLVEIGRVCLGRTLILFVLAFRNRPHRDTMNRSCLFYCRDSPLFKGQVAHRCTGFDPKGNKFVCVCVCVRVRVCACVCVWGGGRRHLKERDHPCFAWCPEPQNRARLHGTYYLCLLN